MRIVHMRSSRKFPDLLPRLLVDLCKEFRYSKCEDRRDKVFGLRAFALDCCKDAVPVDYTISLAEISWILLFHTAFKHTHGIWMVSYAQKVFRALGVTKQDLEDPTPFLRNKSPTEEAGGVDPARTQRSPIDELDIVRWAEAKLGSLGKRKINIGRYS
jgi:hypothetical protein